jgi:ankyrin repeat protein
MGRRYLSLILALLISAGNLIGASGRDVRLIEAVKNADVKTVNALLKQHLDVNAKEPDGTPALHWAVEYDDVSWQSF